MGRRAESLCAACRFRSVLRFAAPFRTASHTTVCPAPYRCHAVGFVRSCLFGSLPFASARPRSLRSLPSGGTASLAFTVRSSVRKVSCFRCWVRLLLVLLRMGLRSPFPLRRPLPFSPAPLLHPSPAHPLSPSAMRRAHRRVRCALISAGAKSGQGAIKGQGGCGNNAHTSPPAWVLGAFLLPPGLLVLHPAHSVRQCAVSRRFSASVEECRLAVACSSVSPLPPPSPP